MIDTLCVQRAGLLGDVAACLDISLMYVHIEILESCECALEALGLKTPIKQWLLSGTWCTTLVVATVLFVRPGGSSTRVDWRCLLGWFGATHGGGKHHSCTGASCLVQHVHGWPIKWSCTVLYVVIGSAFLRHWVRVEHSVASCSNQPCVSLSV